MAGKSGREISMVQTKSWQQSLLKWESILLIIFLLINIMNACISPNYLSVKGLFTATNSFLEKAFIVLPMVYILVLGEIDISVGSIVALSAVLMAMAYNAGVPMVLCVVLCLLIGTLCGFINGIILTKFVELPPMIVTLATQIIFRGIAEVLLGDESAGGLTSVTWFSNLYWGSIGGIVPYMFVVFMILAFGMWFLLHRTTFGRRVYAIGSNRLAAEYAGISVQRIRCLVYTMTGLFSGVTAVFLAARMGSTRSNIASGYELDAISMVVLGGVSTAGGKGNFSGAIIAVFIIGFLRYGLGLVNVASQVILVIIGVLLILAVMLPNIKWKKFIKKSSKKK